MDEYTYAKVLDILKQNSDKPFVKRITDRYKYPVMDSQTGENISWLDAIRGGKEFNTHLMSTIENNGKFNAFPLVQMDDSGQLKRYSPIEAFKRASATGDIIGFDNKDMADMFSKNYKVVWGE